MSINRKFSPLVFLASLGAGGIAVMPFAFLQYTLPGLKGLVTWQQLGHGTLPAAKEFFYFSLESVMIVFTIIHFILTFIFLRQLYWWIKSSEYEFFVEDPLKNAAIVTPFISIAMSMNVFIGPVRFFIPFFSSNFQNLMLPALAVWSIIWILLLRMEIKLLKISFTNSFDVNKISFGWLLHPFALGMVTVTGTGIAAMAKNPPIAHAAAFMALVSGSMGVFLLIVKLIAIFKSHFAADGLPERQFLPSFLVVVPNITLFAISAFRLSHYFEHHMGFHMHTFGALVIILSFAFETWYLLFGLALLGDYLKKHFFNNEFYISQWSFICPIVAYAVLGSFTFKMFVQSPLIYGLIMVTMVLAVTTYFLIMQRHIKCSRSSVEEKKIQCLFDTPAIAAEHS